MCADGKQSYREPTPAKEVYDKAEEIRERNKRK